MKSIKNTFSGIFAATALVSTVACYPSAQAQATPQNSATPQAKPPAALSNPYPVKSENFRGKPFYEILFMNREANGSGIGNYYNSIGNTFDASNKVMDGRFRALNAETLKKKYGGDGIFFNGPRRFVANGVTGLAFDGGKERVMGTI